MLPEQIIAHYQTDNNFVFENEKLQSINLSGAQIPHIRFKNCNLLWANLGAVNAQNAVFDNCILRAVNFKQAQLAEAQFINCNLTEADFSDANAENANFSGCQINTIFVNANLLNADFGNASIHSTQFTNANVQGACFEAAKLNFADFSGANLSEANFSNAIITDAIFTDANLSNVVGLPTDKAYTYQAPPPPNDTPAYQNGYMLGYEQGYKYATLMLNNNNNNKQLFDEQAWKKGLTQSDQNQNNDTDFTAGYAKGFMETYREAWAN